VATGRPNTKPTWDADRNKPINNCDLPRVEQPTTSWPLNEPNCHDGWGPAWDPVSTEASMVEVGGNDHFLTGQADAQPCRIAKVLERQDCLNF